MKIATRCVAVVLILSMTVACTTDQILADLNLALQIAGEIAPLVANISPPDGAAMQRVSAIAKQSLQVVLGGYNAYKQSGTANNLQTLQSAIDAFQAEIPAAIAAAQIKDPKSVAKVAAWLNLIYSVIDPILSAIPQARSGVNIKAHLAKTLPKPADLKAQWEALKR